MPEDVTAAAQGPQIIIKKVYKGGHGHHGGAWKVAYADMVTALMALFIVLWILGQDEEIVKNVAAYFQDPVGFVEGGMVRTLDAGDAAGLAIVPGAAGTSDGEGGSGDAIWREAAGKIRAALAGVPSFDKYRDQIELAIAPEGLRINLIESADTPLFRVGSTELHPETRTLLEAIAVELARLPNQILVEGHTDSRKFGSGSGITNWELSTGRAHTARRVMQGTGIAEERMLEVRGYADRQLYNPLDPEDSRNRRVAITLLSEEASADREKPVEETVLP